MPDVSVFIDTNVLLYIHDQRNPEKGRQSRIWLTTLGAKGQARTNLQSLSEMTHVLLRKKWLDGANTVYAVVDEFAILGSTPVTTVEVSRARQIHTSTGYAWWDCLLLASALELGCKYFLSEDLKDGQVIEGLTIIDPFAHSPEQILVSR